MGGGAWRHLRRLRRLWELKGNASAWPSVLQPELQRRASRTPALMWTLRGGRESGGGSGGLFGEER